MKVDETPTGDPRHPASGEPAKKSPATRTSVRLAPNGRLAQSPTLHGPAGDPSAEDSSAEDPSRGNTLAPADKPEITTNEGVEANRSAGSGASEAPGKTSTRLGSHGPTTKTRLVSDASGDLRKGSEAEVRHQAPSGSPGPKASAELSTEAGAAAVTGADGRSGKKFGGISGGAQAKNRTLLGWALRVVGFVLAAVLLVATGMFVAFTLMPPTCSVVESPWTQPPSERSSEVAAPERELGQEPGVTRETGSNTAPVAGDHSQGSTYGSTHTTALYGVSLPAMFSIGLSSRGKPRPSAGLSSEFS